MTSAYPYRNIAFISGDTQVATPYLNKTLIIISYKWYNYLLDIVVCDIDAWLVVVIYVPGEGTLDDMFLESKEGDTMSQQYHF